MQDGDKGWAYNYETGETELKEVLTVWVKETDELIHVTTSDGETIDTTSNHPFWVENEGWVAACDLDVGNELTTADSSKVEITDIEIEKLAEPVTVYNLTVADDHTYFVGEYGILVHNSKLYEYGRYNEMDSANDGLDLHHAPQGKPASQVINGYDYRTGTAIALPEKVHEKLATLKGLYTGTAKELLEWTEKQLLDAGVPTDIVKDFVEYIKKTYPNNAW